MVENPSVPSLVLSKRHNSILYHRVREAQDAGMLRVGWIPGEYNIATLLTKTIIKGNVIHRVVESIFYNKAVLIRDKDER